MARRVMANNPKAASAWVSVGNGRVTASGAPGRARLSQWLAQGATDIVTLQRADEHAAWLPAACAEVGLGHHHLPLSGRRLDQPEDLAALARIPELLAILRSDPPRSLVVHCSAGLHRTGVCLYILLRHAGLSEDAAITTLAAARPLTAEELCHVGKRGSLLALAEALFGQQIEVPER
jgi:protein-tyrosine phosphatase